MKPLLLLAYLTACVVIGHALAPSWQNDPALWSRTVEVAPHHARAMVNLADAYAKHGDLKSAGRWNAHAYSASFDSVLPERERRTVRMAAASNLVSIALASPHPDPNYVTPLLEEIWQLQSGASPTK